MNLLKHLVLTSPWFLHRMKRTLARYKEVRAYTMPLASSTRAVLLKVANDRSSKDVMVVALVFLVILVTLNSWLLVTQGILRSRRIFIAGVNFRAFCPHRVT